MDGRVPAGELAASTVPGSAMTFSIVWYCRPSAAPTQLVLLGLLPTTQGSCAQAFPSTCALARLQSVS